MYDYKMNESSWVESEWNPANFEKVVFKYQDRIYHFIYGMMWETHLAQDLTQDTFLQAYKALCKKAETGSLSPEAENITAPLQGVSSTITTWLYTIARNNAIDEMRRQKVLKTSSLWYYDESGSEYEASNLAATQPSSDLEYRFTMQVELETAIKKVGRDRMTAFLLYLNGFSYLEICGITGRTLSNVKSQIFRAKESLRQILLKQQKSPSQLYPIAGLNH
jgi:RNA polymerase sigma-70 factor (ECF subfamily)